MPMQVRSIDNHPFAHVFNRLGDVDTTPVVHADFDTPGVVKLQRLLQQVNDTCGREVHFKRPERPAQWLYDSGKC